MTPQERDLLIQMFQRIDAAGDQPRDREAEELIADGVRQLPFAPYLLAQTVLVQEEALKAAGARIEELEAQLKNQPSEPPQSGGSFLGGGSTIFGSRPSTSVPSSGTSPWGRNARDAMQPSPMQQPIPQQQPMAQAAAAPDSGGFLRGALGAAAGVAGGMLLANSIRGLFGGNRNNDHLGIGGGLDRTISNASADAGGAPDMSDIFPTSGGGSDDFSSDYDSSSSDDTTDI